VHRSVVVAVPVHLRPVGRAAGDELRPPIESKTERVAIESGRAWASRRPSCRRRRWARRGAPPARRPSRGGGGGAWRGGAWEASGEILCWIVRTVCLFVPIWNDGKERQRPEGLLNLKTSVLNLGVNG
jgi:hypothetical protein